MKRRHLRILAAVTAIAFLGAIATIVGQSNGSASDFTARLLFPGLADRLADIDHIRVTSFGDEILLVRQESSWRVASRAGYLANEETIGSILRGMAEINLTEAKTQLAERHDDLGLGRTAIGLELDAGGESAAHVLVGSRKRLPAGGLPGSLYVRLPDGDQTWLAETNLAAPSQVKDWLDPSFLVIANERVRQVVSVSPDGEVVTLIRAEPGSQPFRIADMEAGFRMKYVSVGNRLGSVLVGLRFEDVRERSELDFHDAHHVRFLTFDGMVIEAELVKVGFRTWMALEFSAGEPARPNESEPTSAYLMASDLVTADIARYQALTAMWAYEIPGYKGGDFMLGLDDFIEPIPEETAE